MLSVFIACVLAVGSIFLWIDFAGVVIKGFGDKGGILVFVENDKCE